MNAIIKDMASKMKSSLAIVDKTILVKDGKSIVSNLEIDVTFNHPLCAENGVYNIIGTSVTDAMEDYPAYERPVGDAHPLTEEIISVWKALLPFAKKDDLRPVMESIAIQDGHFVTTDAHYLIAVKQNTSMPDVIIGMDAMKHLLWLWGKLKPTSATIAFGDRDFVVSCDQFTFGARLVEGNYPNFMQVIPEQDYEVQVTLPRLDILAAVKEAKKADVILRYVAFDVEKKVAYLEDVDMGFYKEWPIKVSAVRQGFTNALVMPMAVERDENRNYSSENKSLYGIDPNRLFVDTLYVDSNTRAMFWTLPLNTPAPSPAASKFSKEKRVKIIPTSPEVKAKVEIVYYSEKSIALFGDTKPYKDRLTELGCKFNPFLTKDGKKQPGWIASRRREQEVRTFVESL